MKKDPKDLTLYSHRQIRRHSALRKSLLRHLTHSILLEDPFPLLDNSYNLAYIRKRAAEDILCSALEDNANWIAVALEAKSCDKYCPSYLWHKQGFCFPFHSYESYLVYCACLLEEFSSGPFVISRCALHSEIYFRVILHLYRRFVSPSIDRNPFFASHKHSVSKRNLKRSCMKPVQSYFQYILNREVLVKNSLYERGGSLGKDWVSICAPRLCSHIRPRVTLHDHEDLVASLKFLPAPSSSTTILCTFALDDKIRLFRGSHCSTIVSGPLQQTGGTVISQSSMNRVGQVAACSLRSELDIFDMEVGERVASMFAPSSLIVPKGRIEWYAITSSWNGFIATGGNYGVAALWDSRVSQPVEFFQTNKKPEEQKIRSVAIDPTETLLGAACGRTIYIWDIRNSFSILKTVTSSLHSQAPIDHILFDPFHSFKLYAGYRDGGIHCLNILKDKKPLEKIFKQHEAPIVANRPVSVNFDASPDGRHLFGLSRFGKVAVYDVLGDTPLKTVRNHSLGGTAQSQHVIGASDSSSSTYSQRRPSFLGTLGDESSEFLRIATAHNLNSGSDILFATASTSLDVTLWGMK
ncbi:hypothetical protein GpartN1_g4220.t1 [Galdieria partita]|uniref:Uncharacterized protein n=1 Tax=Galdieria partita TaxID=83374 RepID=A0A9C7UQX5_9RHOD|nr:hypothetical protein GpartN1_g4220.t1 [Galdieria partita]